MPDMNKIEHLEGNNYKRWSERILFYFAQIELIQLELLGSILLINLLMAQNKLLKRMMLFKIPIETT